MELKGLLRKTVSPLAKVAWKDNKWTRLVLTLIATGQDTSAKNHLHRMFCGFGDEKVVEDLHEKVRELDLIGKNNVTSVIRRFCAITQSNVLEKRGFRTISVDDMETAQGTYGRMSALVAKLKKACTATQQPSKEWQRITMQKTWRSPNPESLYIGCAAWRWIVHYWKELEGNCEATLTDAWASDLYTFSGIYCDEDDHLFQVLVDGEWSALVCAVRQAEDVYMRDLRGSRPLSWKHVHRSNINGIMHIPTETITRDKVIMYRQTGDPENFVKASMRRGLSLSKSNWEMLALWTIPKDQLAVLLACGLTPFQVLLNVHFEDDDERLLVQQRC